MIMSACKSEGMDLGDLAEYCMSKAGVEETFPFDEVTLVYKVMGKMFALIPTAKEQLSLNLKCDPEYAVELREAHPAIIPGYHMNKKHWNTINVDGSISGKLLCELIDHSYDLVVKSLTRKLKDELSKLSD